MFAHVKNKMKKSALVSNAKKEAIKERLKRRLEQRKLEQENPALKAERLATNIPATLENTREIDLTVEMDEEVDKDLENDEFASYFSVGVAPKVLITTSKRASAQLYEFTQELTSLFPEADFIKRGKIGVLNISLNIALKNHHRWLLGSQFEIPKMAELAAKRQYSDLLIVNEDNKKPSKFIFNFKDTITLVHLPHGPTAVFKLTSVQLNKKIRGHGKPTSHTPELILNNFSTRLGHTM